MPEFLPGSNLVTIAEPSYDLDVFDRGVTQLLNNPRHAEHAERIRGEGRLRRAVKIDLGHAIDDCTYDRLCSSGIDGFLSEADRAFEFMARSVGCTAAEHTWVAFEYESDDTFGFFGEHEDRSVRDDLGIPEGFVIGMDMGFLIGSTLRGNSPWFSSYAMTGMASKLTRAQFRFRGLNGWAPWDVSVKQFMQEHPGKKPQNIRWVSSMRRRSNVKLVDLEPMISA